jgi:predicted nuclease of restriction endonuclease-like (RecB) superfamily
MARKRSAEGKIENRNALGRRRKDAMFPVAPTRAGLPSGYAGILRDLKQRIQQERLRTVMAANSAMVLLYWDIGRTILERQDREGWGARVIDRLSTDLREAFPNMQGLSPRNLKYMRAFAAAWSDRTIVQRVVAQIPWRRDFGGHSTYFGLMVVENRAGRMMRSTGCWRRTTGSRKRNWTSSSTTTSSTGWAVTRKVTRKFNAA